MTLTVPQESSTATRLSVASLARSAAAIAALAGPLGGAVLPASAPRPAEALRGRV